MSESILLDLHTLIIRSPGGKVADLAGNYDREKNQRTALASFMNQPIPEPADFTGFPVPPSVHRDRNGGIWLDWNESSATGVREIADCLTDRMLQICLEWSHESPCKIVHISAPAWIHPDWLRTIRLRLDSAFDVKIGS